MWGKRNGTDPVKVENAWPAITDRDTFDKVGVTLKSRGPRIIHPRRTVSDYLLSGLMKCGVCGKPMSGHSAKSGRFFYYRCTNDSKQGAEECRGHFIPKSKIENFIIDKIRNCILTDENLTELVRLTNEDLETSVGSDKQQLQLIQKQIVDVDSRLENLYDALETKAFSSEELAPRIRIMQSKKNELITKRTGIQSSLQSKPAMPVFYDIQEYVSDLKSLLAASPIVEQRAFLKLFVDSIKVDRNEITINYFLPMPPASNNTEVVGVLPFVMNGRPYRDRTCDTLIKSERHDVPPGSPK